MFVVWEPILPTDRIGATNVALRRITDSRARQYWDAEHVLASRMAADARPPQPVPACCETGGVLWDLAAVYPKGARWGAAIPPALLFDGTVLDVAEKLEAALAAP